MAHRTDWLIVLLSPPHSLEHPATMSNSNLPVHLQVSKATTFSNQIPVPSQSFGVSNLVAAERQRRGGSSFVSSPTTKHNSTTTSSSPRNNQSLRKQNKISKRPKLFEEMPDTGTIRMSGRRGQTDITHLMDITLPPRSYNHSYQGSGGNHRSHLNRRNHYSWGYNAANKAR